MKKLQEPVAIADVYHTIKSPIVSIKSMLFVLGRNREVQSNKVLQEKISQIEEKVNLLHKRSEIFLNYIFFKDEPVEFLYSFFNLNELLQEVVQNISHQKKSVSFIYTNPQKHPIMADCDQIQEALRIIFTRVQTFSKPGTVSVELTSLGKEVQIQFRYKKLADDPEKKPITSDDECVAREENYIAERFIELHGGTIIQQLDSGEVEVKIQLLVKAKPSSVKK